MKTINSQPIMLFSLPKFDELNIQSAYKIHIVAFGEGKGGARMPRSQRSNPKIKHQAGELRKELTLAERKLWAYLRGDKLNGVNFRRQHAVGRYIADFCSVKEKLIIELDGSQHLGQEGQDTERTKYLESQGYKVIRFWNNQVTNDMDGVILAITQALEAPSQPPPNTKRRDLGEERQLNGIEH